MSYTDDRGRLTGFNVEFGRALCATMKVQCEFVPMAMASVIDRVAAGSVDFAAVSFLITPERRQKVLFSKPYYRSLSTWIARPGVQPGGLDVKVAVVKGSAQASYAQSQDWNRVELPSHHAVRNALLEGQATAALLPMLTALGLTQDKAISTQGWVYQLMQSPSSELSGDVGLAVNPQNPDLRVRIDAAIDQVKRDGRFDRINSDFLPFKLQ